jgi:methyl-accepting chemotaxis protein
MPHRDELSKALAELLKEHAFEVGSALDAHQEWKRRLRDAVIRGYCDQDSDEVGRDDLCALGRWLYALPLESCADKTYDQLVELHACFHREAAKVAEFLEEGRIDDARAAMDADSDFARASAELVFLLESWQAAA